MFVFRMRKRTRKNIGIFPQHMLQFCFTFSFYLKVTFERKLTRCYAIVAHSYFALSCHFLSSLTRQTLQLNTQFSTRSFSKDDVFIFTFVKFTFCATFSDNIFASYFNKIFKKIVNIFAYKVNTTNNGKPVIPSIYLTCSL